MSSVYFDLVVSNARHDHVSIRKVSPGEGMGGDVWIYEVRAFNNPHVRGTLGFDQDDQDPRTYLRLVAQVLNDYFHQEEEK